MPVALWKYRRHAWQAQAQAAEVESGRDLIDRRAAGGDLSVLFRQMRALIPKLLPLSFLVLVAAVIANAVIAYQATLQMIGNQRLVAHTQEVLLELAATLSAVQDAETGQRGFLITGSETYLEPYHQAIGAVDGRLRRLGGLVEDNPRQRERLNQLAPVIASRLEILRQNLVIRQTQGAEAARQLVATGRGKREMDRARALIAAMSAQERALLKERAARSEKSGRRALLTFSLANCVLLLLASLAFVLVRQHFRERARTEALLLQARAELEQRVQERTAELAQANRQLNAFTQDLKRSNRELQDFAFVASHDLQEPLRKIQAFGDRLKTKHGAALNEEARDYLARMQAAAQRMHTLINDLLTFSRVTSRALPFEPVDLGRVAHEVLSDLEVRAQQVQAQVEIAELPTVDADPLQMRQLFQNLIANALKFHRAGVPPVLRIAAAEAQGDDGAPAVQLSFEDNGIGFDLKYLDRIFTPFQRLHGRGEYEGTGIGLAVCRRIVERHGGSITARSQEGSGTVFLVVLPLRQSALPSIEKEPEWAQPARSSS
jgi:signal transduction histidine kinase